MSAERGVPLILHEGRMLPVSPVQPIATHRAFPEAEAAALVDVAEAARRTITCRQGVPAEVQQAQRDLYDAYGRLDEARR